MKNKFLFIAATHGNENFSVPVLQYLEKKYPKDKFAYEWIIGNERAYEKKVRYTEKDLNRSAPGSLHSEVYEERRAAELVQLSENYDFVIDIHGADTNCGATTLITHPTLSNLFLASLFDIDRNVVWYSSSSLQKGPHTQFSKSPAIEIECGPKYEEKTADELQRILEKFIGNYKDLQLKAVLKSIKNKEFYVVYGKILGEHEKGIDDFVQTKKGAETFYPYMANQYTGILCYKMKKVKVEELFLY